MSVGSIDRLLELNIRWCGFLGYLIVVGFIGSLLSRLVWFVWVFLFSGFGVSYSMDVRFRGKISSSFVITVVAWLYIIA